MKSLSRTTLVLLLIAFALLNCRSTVEVYRYQYDTTLDRVFVKQGADFSKYNSVMVDQLSVWYPSEYEPSQENAALVQANLARAQGMFRESVANALADRYPVVTKAGKNTLRIHVEFVDLRAVPDDAKIPADLSRYEFKVQPGHITMIGWLFDSVSGEKLARAADQGKQKSVGGFGRVDWQAIAADFDYWAQVFSAWLDQVHEK
ncbi:MAG: hypothetical protein ACI9H8_000054 [Lysobacterales bacterium]|jgi:hypothetical protein